jgi:hypothetical protein
MPPKEDGSAQYQIPAKRGKTWQKDEKEWLREEISAWKLFIH